MNKRVFVLSPTFTADWHLSLRFLVLIGAVLFSISIYFSYLGLWLIIPFAGLEFGALLVSLWLSANKSNEKNVLIITDYSVTLEKGRKTRSSSVTFEKIWCEIILEHLPRRWKHTRLFLRCKDDKVEFAEFLDADEQSELSKKLKNIIGPVGV